MKNCYAAILLVPLLFAALPATANDLVTASQALCEKVKTCSMAQVKEEDMTPEVRQMMEPMLDNMCANMRSRIEEVPTDHPTYPSALACTRSMAALSCADFQDEQKLQTPACEEYRKLVSEAQEEG